MYNSLWKIKKEMKELDNLYKDKIVSKQEYKIKLDYLKECANFLKYEKKYAKTK